MFDITFESLFMIHEYLVNNLDLRYYNRVLLHSGTKHDDLSISKMVI